MKPYDELNAKQIIQYFAGKLNNYAIAGLLGNWNIESNLRPNNAQNSYMTKLGITDEEYTNKVDAGLWARPDTGENFAHDHIGYGLAQWTSSGRKQGLWDHCMRSDVSISNMQAQLEYAEIELFSASYKTTKDGLDNCKSASEAALIIMTTYEKPASKDDPEKQQIRMDEAEEFYKKYFGDSKNEIVIAISAGHYKYTAGKRCDKSLDPNETREWYLNSRIAEKLTEKLEKFSNVRIVRVDDPTGEEKIELITRKMKAEAENADFYLAIHHNATKEVFSGGGVVVYYYPTDKNKAQAQMIYDDVVGENGLIGDRAQKIVPTTELYEVWAPSMDSILLENGFMTSTVDVPIILTDEFAEKTATGLAKFFIEYFDLQIIPEPEDTDKFAVILAVKHLQEMLNWYGNYGLEITGELDELTLGAYNDFRGK